MNDSLELSIVLPCYNEAKSLSAILERFAKAGRGVNFELVLVDNGSQDDTSEVLTRLLPQFSFARTVKVEVNQGYGHGVRTGLQAANGDVLCWSHADLQTDPADVFRGFQLYQQAASPRVLVKGRRVGRNRSERFISWAMQTLATILFRRRMHEINAQPKVFHRDLLPLLVDPPKDFNFDLYVLWSAMRSGWTVESFEVRFPPRVHGQSHWSATWKSKLRTISGAVRYMTRLAILGDDPRSQTMLSHQPTIDTCPTLSSAPPRRAA